MKILFFFFLPPHNSSSLTSPSAHLSLSCLTYKSDEMDRLLAARAKPWWMSPLIKVDFPFISKRPISALSQTNDNSNLFINRWLSCSTLMGWKWTGLKEKVPLATKWKVTVEFCKEMFEEAFCILLNFSDIHRPRVSWIWLIFFQYMPYYFMTS